ncbi:MAG: hypothetical protein A2987_05645 [Omnitrophica bacterium RIFCSPLOWO2_01_FULL_45_10]|nr:MAG: hypothetical protein A2987_05645 [Omnitrophica bacterium RIFCSPLOWO2_01_FULL_45_10]
MERVLITGASGFIGRSLVGVLSNTSWEVLPFVRGASGLENEIVVDLCSQDLIQRIDKLPRIDAIVHLGALIGWDDVSKEAMLKTNVDATARLSSWAKAKGAYFLFASMALVYGAANTFITSASRLNPDTEYGRSKLLAEDAVRTSGVNCAIIRMAGVFGKDGPRHLGINRAIADSLAGRPVVQYGDGNIRRNYIYVEDMAQTMKFFIDNKTVGTHLAAGAHINTIAGMLQIICDVLRPGSIPEHREGEKSYDQIVERSCVLPKDRSFKEAIIDIKYRSEMAQACPRSR